MNFKNKKVRKYVKLKKIHFDSKDKILKSSKCQSTYHFSLIREKYFINLQNVIKENLKSAEKESLSDDSLEKISLEIEQQALLACMQCNVYQAVMSKIIRSIKRNTKKMKLHFEIKNVLSLNNKEANSVLPSLQNEKEIDESPVLEQESVKNEIYSHIPTISSVRTNHNDINEHFLPNEYESQINIENNTEIEKNEISSFANSNVLEICETRDSIQTPYSPYINEQNSSFYNGNNSVFTSNFIQCSKTFAWNQKLEKLTENDGGKTVESDERTYQNLVTVLTEKSQSNSKNNDISNKCDETPCSDEKKLQEKIDPIALSRNKLQKSVENSLKNFSRIKRLRKEECEKEQIEKILEGTLTSDHDENQLDSLSDESTGDQTESEEKYVDRLAERLEKMKQIFGVEEDKFRGKMRQTREIQECAKRNNMQKSQKFTQVWHHERTIQMHKYSMLASETTPEMRSRNRNLFLKLFDEDSDEENEKEFYSEEKYLNSCKERISSWVVKYLMPFYNKRRIIGKQVFKSLGYHVANAIIEQIQYPDEWTVQYLITKFFPNNVRFVSEEDIRLFQID